MENRTLTIIAMSCTLGYAQAGYAQTGNEMEEGEVVDLTAIYKDHNGTLGPRPPKGPVQVPYVTLDDHTLYIWSQHNGYTLTLYDDNDTVVYQSYVAPGTQMVSLPTTLSGSYTLLLSDDTYLYTGVIDL
jgi:hypothetical protein